jgi:hypothetical protein
VQPFLLSRLLSSSEFREDGQTTSVRWKAINMASGTWEKGIDADGSSRQANAIWHMKVAL